jgi:hypothetical protein
MLIQTIRVTPPTPTPTPTPTLLRRRVSDKQEKLITVTRVIIAQVVVGNGAAR